MPDSVVHKASSSLRTSLWGAAIFSVALLLLFHSTAWSMVAIWLRSETFAHGFLILPISLWLVWNQRDRLRNINPVPAPAVALLLLPIGFGWLLATLVDVLVVQQLALVAMLVAGLWAILGHQLARALAFPLLFLFLAVPMGEALVAPMMEFTATSTVWLIQHTGIPVFREGLYFTLPSGQWSVVEACSGVRYIIASVTLGLLYAYLTYHSFARRFWFVVASLIVPIFANTARAYIIVMLGHLSDMRVATGVDHLVYGWVFFGLVMFILFWLGSFFREDQPGSGHTDGGSSVGQHALRSSYLKPMATAFISLLVAALWPWLAHTAESRAGFSSSAMIVPPASAGSWQRVSEAPWRWQPENAVGGEVTAYYQRAGQVLSLVIQYSSTTDTAGEIVGSSTRFSDNKYTARVMDRDRVKVQLLDGEAVVDEAQIFSGGGQLLAWSWYRIGDLYTSNDYVAKFMEALAALGIKPSGSTRILLVLPIQDSVSATREQLKDFLREQGAGLDEALSQGMAGGQ